MDDGQAPVGDAGEGGEQGKEASISFHRRDLRAQFQQGARQSSWPRAHFQHPFAGRNISDSRYLPADIEIKQKVLTQPLVCVQLRQGVTQWRQLGEIHTAPRRVAILAAIRKAAIKLSGRAWPLPAISNATPWSGDVRTIGRPKVTFTPPQKSSIFTGIRA